MTEFHGRLRTFVSEFHGRLSGRVTAFHGRLGPVVAEFHGRLRPMSLALGPTLAILFFVVDGKRW
jgi:ribosomal protein L35AE/L33A